MDIKKEKKLIILKQIGAALYVIWMLYFAIDLEYGILSHYFPRIYNGIFKGIIISIVGYELLVRVFIKDKNNKERKKVENTALITIIISVLLYVVIIFTRILYTQNVIALAGLYMFAIIGAIFIAPLCMMIWNESCKLSNSDVMVSYKITAAFLLVGLLMLLIECIAISSAIFLPTSDFVITKKAVLIYNIISASFCVLAILLRICFRKK